MNSSSAAARDDNALKDRVRTPVKVLFILLTLLAFGFVLAVVWDVVRDWIRLAQL